MRVMCRFFVPLRGMYLLSSQVFHTIRPRKISSAMQNTDIFPTRSTFPLTVTLPMSRERQEIVIQSQIDDILEGIDELKRSESSKFQIKAMERTRKSLQKQLDKLQKANQDDTLTFEQLGVDKLFIDEAHECTTRS